MVQCFTLEFEEDPVGYVGPYKLGKKLGKGKIGRCKQHRVSMIIYFSDFYTLKYLLPVWHLCILLEVCDLNCW